MANNSWRISVDFKSEMQFWSYIGREEGFVLTPANGEQRSSVEESWRYWWEQLLNGLTFDNYLELYRPPDFDGLAATPLLQALCQTHWPSFRQLWSGKEGLELVMVQKLRTQLRNLELNKQVAAISSAKGKTKADPFELSILFVLWPSDYYHVVANHRVILGFAYLEPEALGDFSCVIEEHVARLA